MKLTPLDILQRRFTKRWRGFDSDEVKDFLEVTSAELEELIRENRFLEDELKKAHHTLSLFREREDALKETMITAQKVTKDMKENVEREAEIILGEARIEAEQIVGVARRRGSKLSEEIAALERQRLRFESEFKGMIETHMKILDASKEREADLEEESKIKYLNPSE